MAKKDWSTFTANEWGNFTAQDWYTFLVNPEVVGGAFYYLEKGGAFIPGAWLATVYLAGQEQGSGASPGVEASVVVLSR